jgi:oxalate decarboxylase/phosphoglucose isomerase-like protein (cupin superfamily)
MPSSVQTPTREAREVFRVGADEITFRVTARESGGALSAFEVRMPAGGGPPLLHRHDPFELYCVETGEFAFYVENADGAIERTVRGAGARVSIPAGREHTIRNESGARARALVILAPGDEIEGFIRDAAAAAADGRIEPSDVIEAAIAHRIEFTRPLAEVA